MVAHACHPSYQETKIRRIKVPGQAREKKKVGKTSSQWWHMPVIPATSVKWENCGPGNLGKK
jgi:hypothetical protein